MQRSDWQDFLQLLAPFPGRLEFTLRLALICALTTLVAAAYQTPEPALTAYVVFFMNKPDRTTSIILNLALVIVITVVIGLVFLLTRAVIDEPFLRVGCITIVSLVFLFLASASKLQPVAGTVALIIAYALDLLGSAPTAELITRGLLYAWLFIGIPAGVSIVVNLLLAPAPRQIAERNIAERLKLAAAVLRDAGERERRQFQALLDEGSTEIFKAIKLAGVERSAPHADLAALGKAARSTTAILLLIEMIERDLSELTDEVRRRIATTLDEMAEILEQGGYPVDIALDLSDLATPVTPLARHILSDLQQAITRFAEPLEAPPPAPVKKSGGFFAADAFTNPDHTRYALKATAAAMICYLLYTLLDWPGIHTCFLTCYIVSLGTTAETVEKLTLRIMGCLLGAVIGIGAIVFVIPHLTSIGELMALVFAGTVIAGWVAAGTPRISYAGFQIAFAFFLCVVQGTKPAFDLVVARDRIIGILIGNVVVYLIFTNLWPVSVKGRIDAAAASLLRMLAQMAVTTNRAARLMMASNCQAMLGGLSQNLTIAGYEPVDLRPERDWIASRRRALDAARQMMGPIYLEADLDVPNAASAARRLGDCANEIAPLPVTESSGPTLPDAETVGSSGPADVTEALRTQIDTKLRDLQMALAEPSSELQAVSYAPA